MPKFGNIGHPQTGDLAAAIGRALTGRMVSREDLAAARHAPLFEPQHLARVYQPQGWIAPVLLVNGRIAGTWQHTRAGGRLTVEMDPSGRLPAWAREQLHAEAERPAEFLGCTLAATGW